MGGGADLPVMMKAIRLYKPAEIQTHPLELTEVEDPIPNKDQVKIRVLACVSVTPICTLLKGKSIHLVFRSFQVTRW
jgi:hypothetical protein